MDTLYGVDVAVLRADDLDKKVIAYIERAKVHNDAMRVLDLGCGAGGQSLRMAQAGACVTGVDIGDYTSEFARLRAEYGLSEEVLRFVCGDVASVESLFPERYFTLCTIQRAIHYVPYSDALALLRYIRQMVTDRLYVSVTGLESDIGRSYAHASLPIAERFCRLSEFDAQTFRIHQPVCLYTPEEFMVVLQEAGWEIQECWVSAFGNVKAICT